MGIKKGRRVTASFVLKKEAPLRRCPLSLKTGCAEDRSSSFRFWSGFEGDLTGVAALSADSVVERPITLNGLTGRAADLATLRSLQVALGVEFLFSVRERKHRCTIAAGKLLISHNNKRRKIKC